MAQLTDVVHRHGGRVFADEIHAPLVYPGMRHIPYAATCAGRRLAYPDRDLRLQGAHPNPASNAGR